MLGFRVAIDDGVLPADDPVVIGDGGFSAGNTPRQRGVLKVMLRGLLPCTASARPSELCTRPADSRNQLQHRLVVVTAPAAKAREMQEKTAITEYAECKLEEQVKEKRE